MSFRAKIPLVIVFPEKRASFFFTARRALSRVYNGASIVYNRTIHVIAYVPDTRQKWATHARSRRILFTFIFGSVMICHSRGSRWCDNVVCACPARSNGRTMSMRTTMFTTTKTTMFERKSGDSTLLTNGNGNLAGDIRKGKPARFWTSIRLNEWTFSLSLLALSLSIVIGKLYANYGE